MSARSEMESLVGFEGRVAGSDAERRAAEHLASRLRDLRREADVEPIRVWPRHALTHALHATLAVAGSAVSVGNPTVGASILAVAIVATLGDLTGTVYLLRRLTGSRASQNVTSPEHAESLGTLILVAHYDAGRGGSLFGPRVAEWRARLAKRLRIPLGLGGGLLLAMVAVLACAVVRLFGIESTPLSVAQFVPTVVLILSIPVLLDVQFSAPSPGAADNASGVATVLELAERHGDHLENVSLWVVLTGAQEPMALGMRSWLRAHRRDLPTGATFVINIDRAANGTVRYTARDGPIVPLRLDRDLVGLCEEIAAEDEENRFEARAMTGRSPSDALAARARGYRAVTISCLDALDHQPRQHLAADTPDQVDDEALAMACDFCSELIERIDARLGAEATDQTSEAPQR